MSTRVDESIAVRVERLERENRRLKRVLLVAAVVAAAGLMLAPSAPKKKPLETVKAREVQIVDDQGNARISMKLEANGDPVLALIGAKGSGARLALIGDRPVLALSDETRVRASLQITKDGAGLDLEDAEGKRGASMQAGGTLGFLLEDTGTGRAEGGLVIGAIGPAVVLSTPDDAGVTEVLLQASRGTEPLITASRGLAAAKLDVSREGGSERHPFRCRGARPRRARRDEARGREEEAGKGRREAAHRAVVARPVRRRGNGHLAGSVELGEQHEGRWWGRPRRPEKAV